MRVYEVTGRPGYGVALGIVAANNQDEAIALIKKNDSTWSTWVDDISARCIRGMSSTTPRPRVMSSITYIE